MLTSFDTVATAPPTLWFDDSRSREEDEPPWPGTGAVFFTTCVTVTLPPGRVAGGANVVLGTVRSACTTLSRPVRTVLLVSSASGTVSPESVITRIRYCLLYTSDA